MYRLLPPLVVLAAFGVVALRCAGQPARAEARAQITGMVQGSEAIRARDRLAEYLARYDEPEDHWYAARMYLRLARPTDALDVIWRDARLAQREGAGRRFAEMALYTLGWDDMARTLPTGSEPRVLVTLVEGGDAWALERLRTHARTLPLMHVTSYFFPAYRLASRLPLDTLVAEFRGRDDEKFLTAAALGALGPDPYPERESDLARLIAVLDREAWRRQYRSVWCVACLALGRSGEPRAIEALKATAARLDGSLRVRDQEDLLLVRNGLLASGDWAEDAPLAASVFGETPFALATIWYLEALIYRYHAGDMRSELRLRQMWEGPGKQYPDLRDRAARAFLLQENLPDEEAQRVWVDRMLRELEADDAPLMSHVLARAYRLRRGLPGARDALLDAMHRAGQSPDGLAGFTEPFVEALRALYLYD